MSEELLDENVDAIIISAYHKDSIEESIENFKDGTKIIDTIEVKVKEESSKQVDVNVMEETFTIYVSGIDQYGDSADVILLGPQVRYELKNVKAKYPGKPVETINMQDYGMMNGAKVLDFALELGGK